MTSMYGGRGPMTGSSRGQLSGDVIPKGYKQGQLQQFTPQQMKLFEQMFSHLGPDSYLNKLAGGDEDTFNQIEAPALRQFSGLQGGLASRFSGMGQGARKSSGFMNTASSAASNFAQELQANRQSLTRQALMDLMGLSNSLLGQRPQDRFLVEKQQKQPSPWGEIAGKFAGAIPGAIAGFATGGPPGAAAGAGYSFLNDMNKPSSYNY